MAHFSCFLNKRFCIFILHWALNLMELAPVVEMGEVSHRNMGNFIGRRRGDRVSEQLWRAKRRLTATSDPGQAHPTKL